MKKPEAVEVTLDTIVGGGQSLGTLSDGRKIFVWGGLPGERVQVQVSKKKKTFFEGVAAEILLPSPERTSPKDPESYLSTSPWQIMSYEMEQRFKNTLVADAFKLHHIDLPSHKDIYSNHRFYHYRNKVEFSWYGDIVNGRETLDLAFFKRGSKGKVIVEDSALLPPEMVRLAISIRNVLRNEGVKAKELKTLLIRCDGNKQCIWQLYVKDDHFPQTKDLLRADLPAVGGEVIYSSPKSPASIISERLGSIGETSLCDMLIDTPFRYAVEGFFQVNLPVYEKVLRDMREWIPTGAKVVDLYSGVGTIGLTVGGNNVTLIESNEYAVREMKRNIEELNIPAFPVLTIAEQALGYIHSDSLVIVDPPRAGLHADVINKISAVTPPRILYLSCNPVTQARDIALLRDRYSISHYQAYNFFPRTPHIEGFAVLTLR